MQRAMIVYTTCATEHEARHIARVLVEERLAACVQRLPGLLSTYVWKGEVRDDPEVLLIIKTRSGLYPQVEARIRALHSYEVPEIVALPIETGSGDYLAWLNASTT